ncbi:uncharacterized protein LOC124496166 [Dermatophagoides farinae]|uniref:Uncharacterized protein n=2 Tax=Dermatophagoides farinae TaxID=6954 RepID=A0A922I5G3_DERFA|nr:hypothetical protein DERF_004749 [Dermatophagoides farinae]
MISTQSIYLLSSCKPISSKIKMLKLFIISAFVAVVYGSYGVAKTSSSLGYNRAAGLGARPQTVAAAIQTRHELNFVHVPTTQNLKPTTIEIGASKLPITILFRSSSSSLNVQQAHDGATGSTQETSSEDEPHRLVHTVKKPIIQELYEIITPIRKISQQVKPVQEEILTVVARNQGGQASSFSGLASTSGIASRGRSGY